MSVSLVLPHVVLVTDGDVFACGCVDQFDKTMDVSPVPLGWQAPHEAIAARMIVEHCDGAVAWSMGDRD